MTMRVSDTVLNNSCDGAVDSVDTGAGTAVGELWSGSPPATLGGAPAGDLLASFNLQNPAFGAASGGVATLAGTPISTTGAADGTVGFFRVKNRNNDVVWDDDDVNTSGSNVVLNTLSVSNGVDVELTSYTFDVTPGS